MVTMEWQSKKLGFGVLEFWHRSQKSNYDFPVPVTGYLQHSLSVKLRFDSFPLAYHKGHMAFICCVRTFISHSGLTGMTEGCTFLGYSGQMSFEYCLNNIPVL